MIEKGVKTVNGKRITTPEYRSWQMMRNRCLNPHTPIRPEIETRVRAFLERK